MLPSWYLLVPILLPVIGGLVVGLCDPVGKKDRPRTWWTGSVLALSLLSVLPVLFSPALELPLFRLSDNLPVFLRSDDTGKYFAAVMSFVWCMAGFYSFGYLKGEEHLPRYYAFTLITMGVLMALCFSGNIITYYMCYELMTLSSRSSARPWCCSASSSWRRICPPGASLPAESSMRKK